MKKLTEKQITRLFAAPKQERPEGTIATQEPSYVGMSFGGKTTEIIKGNPSNLYMEQEIVSEVEVAYRRLNNKIEAISEIVKELQQDIQQLKNRI